MAERFLDLIDSDRFDALAFASDRTGRPAHLLEKDVWVVWILRALYGSPIADGLTFKGGTSLSKAYRVIDRLSIVPEGAAYTALEADFEAMSEDQVLLARAVSFDSLMDACKELELEANRAARLKE